MPGWWSSGSPGRAGRACGSAWGTATFRTGTCSGTTTSATSAWRRAFLLWRSCSASIRCPRPPDQSRPCSAWIAAPFHLQLPWGKSLMGGNSADGWVQALSLAASITALNAWQGAGRAVLLLNGCGMLSQPFSCMPMQSSVCELANWTSGAYFASIEWRIVEETVRGGQSAKCGERSTHRLPCTGMPMARTRACCLQVGVAARTVDNDNEGGELAQLMEALGRR